jgi:hypothetical protein
LASGGISGSATLRIAGTSSLAGLVTAENGLTVTGTVSLPANSLTASQINNFTADVRGQFSNGTGVSISSGQISIGQAVGTGNSVTFAGLTVSGSTQTSGSITVTGGGSQIILGSGYGGAGATLSSDNGNISTKGSITVDSDLTVGGNLTVNGITTTVDTQNLLVEDPIIQLGSGSNGNANGDRGFIFSRASGNKVFFWDEDESKFRLATTATSGTTNTIVPDSLEGLEVAALTASEGVDLGSGKGITVSGADLLKKQETTAGPGGVYQITGAILNDPYGTTSASSFIRLAHVSGSGQENDQVDIQIAGGATFKLDSTQGEIKSGGGELVISDSTSSLKSNSVVEINANGNGEVRLGAGSDSILFQYNGGNFGGGGGLLNLGTVLDDISGALGGGLTGGEVTSSVQNAYRQLRVVGKGLITGSASPANRVTFLLSGSTTTTENAAVNTIKGLYNMSDASPSTLLQTKVKGLSFDVALYDGGTQAWVNDLVSVSITASLEGSTYYPKFIIDAPGASNGTEVRLIAINEEPEDFDM